MFRATANLCTLCMHAHAWPQLRMYGIYWTRRIHVRRSKQYHNITASAKEVLLLLYHMQLYIGVRVLLSRARGYTYRTDYVDTRPAVAVRWPSNIADFCADRQ